MITKKYIKELEKKYIGKRIMLDVDDYNEIGFLKGIIGTITEISLNGQLKFEADNGGCIYIIPEDKFHEVYNWEL